MRRAQSVPGAPEEVLQRCALAYWNFAHTPPELYQVMHGLDGIPFGAAQTPTEARESFAQLREAVVHVLEQSAKLSHSDVNREVDMFWAALHGLVSLSLAGRLAGDKQRAMELVVSTSERFSASWHAKFQWRLFFTRYLPLVKK